jgi:serine/threonine protein kinase
MAMSNIQTETSLVLAEEAAYEIGRLIGEGGMARVFEGVHRERGFRAAIKFPKGGPWAFERFRQEIEALEQLDHMHVMPLLEVDRRRGWYAMPLALCSLRDLRREDPMAWPGFLKALGSIAGGMIHAHSLGWVHRDASPDNVLRLANGHWVLADFGIAHLRAPRAGRPQTEALIGTADFTAPEVRHEPAAVGPAADAWSIGALARWFTSIGRESQPTSPAGRFWWALIDGTTRLDPGARWTLPEIASHLNAPPAQLCITPTPRSCGPFEQCACCRDRAGVDPAGRCRACGHMGED